jgi:quercetin dioxygenase-like cupin family protein
VALENPATGERIVFLERSSELLRLELTLPAGGSIAGPHVHPSQEERFEVLAGSPTFRVGRRTATLRPGEAIAVPPGVPHRWWNRGADHARVLIEFRPALRTDALFERLAELGRRGRLTRGGWPYPREAIGLGLDFADEAIAGILPAWLQRAFLALAAPLARR